VFRGWLRGADDGIGGRTRAHEGGRLLPAVLLVETEQLVGQRARCPADHVGHAGDLADSGRGLLAELEEERTSSGIVDRPARAARRLSRTVSGVRLFLWIVRVSTR
jgi:hypothetical protein